MSAPGTFRIEWVDHGREPQCPPNPDHPSGIDVDTSGGAPSCSTTLPYPAKRCGYFVVECRVCGYRAAVTTAGRPDDPRSVTVACPIKSRRIN